MNRELDRFDKKILKALKENDSLNLAELMVKTNNRENRGACIKRLRELEDMELIIFDETNYNCCGYVIKLSRKHGIK